MIGDLLHTVVTPLLTWGELILIMIGSVIAGMILAFILLRGGK